MYCCAFGYIYIQVYVHANLYIYVLCVCVHIYTHTQSLVRNINLQPSFLSPGIRLLSLSMSQYKSSYNLKKDDTLRN